MKYDNVKNFKDERFRRVTGVKSSTFEAMLDMEIEVIVVDTTEIPIERSKNSQMKYYSGKKTTYAKSATGYRQKNRANNLHRVFLRQSI